MLILQELYISLEKVNIVLNNIFFIPKKQLNFKFVDISPSFADTKNDTTVKLEKIITVEEDFNERLV